MGRLAIGVATAVALFLAQPSQAQSVAPNAIGDPHFAAAIDQLQKGGAEALRSAAVEQRARLASLSRDANQAAWADGQEALGDILLALAFGELAEAMPSPAVRDCPSAEEAEVALRAALNVRSREADPERWARLQIKLAMAVLWQPKRHTTLDAVEHFRAALPAYWQAGARIQWATTQASIAYVLQYVARNDEVQLPEAIAAAAAAADEFDALHMAQEAQAARGIAEDLRQMQAEVDGLRERVVAFSATNPQTFRASDPQRWASANLTFAEALLNEAEGSRWSGAGRNAYIWREAASVVRASLDVLSAERSPEEWARAQHNLGRAFQGEGGDGARRQAVAAYTAALSVRARQRGSEDWARSESNLMHVLDEISRYDESAAPAALAAAHEIFEHRSGVRMGDYMDALNIVERLEGSERADEYLERLDNR